ncbi:MAG: LytR/AlgR family response regulator transcription factor [Gemmatimonadales bacterium]
MTPSNDAHHSAPAAPARSDRGLVRAFIADDEPGARRRIRDAIAGVDWLECVGEAADGATARGAIEHHQPDVLFLDVRMPRMDGIRLLENLAAEPYVVFVTAYSEFAVTAFELAAVDYVLKPFSAERLARSFERVRWSLEHPESPSALSRARGALSGQRLTRLFVRRGGAIIPIAVDTITYLKARRDYVEVRTEAGRFVAHATLSGLLERLDPTRFVRVHRSHAVNLDRVPHFGRRADGRLEATMPDGTTLVVGRRCAARIRQLSH